MEKDSYFTEMQTEVIDAIKSIVLEICRENPEAAKGGITITMEQLEAKIPRKRDEIFSAINDIQDSGYFPAEPVVTESTSGIIAIFGLIKSSPADKTVGISISDSYIEHVLNQVRNKHI